jgi:hypothetical protein
MGFTTVKLLSYLFAVVGLLSAPLKVAGQRHGRESVFLGSLLASWHPTRMLLTCHACSRQSGTEELY